MLQTQWTESGLDVREVVPGPLQPGWVRLRVAACGICGSDLHQYRGEMRRRAGGVPGHEFVGAVTDGPAGLADRLYAIEPWTHCGRCDLCRSGRQHLCTEGLLIGGQVPGGLAAWADVPEYTLHPVAPSVPPLAASMAEPLAVGVRAIHLARLETDSRVLVLGGGTIGLLAGLLARDRAAEVGITVRHPHQRAAAQTLGLTPIAEADVLAWAKEREPDVVIETVGGPAPTLDQAIQACRRSGRIIVLGIFTARPAFDAFRVVVRELQVIGSIVYGHGQRGSEFGAAVGLLPRYLSEVQRLQTHQFPLTAAHEAFACAAGKRSGAIKVTLLPNS